MKTFTFRYDPHPRKSAMASISKSLRTGALDVELDSIACKSMDDMMKLMTKTRFQVFAAIVEKSPDSLTELADVLKKDLGNVLRDAKMLESLGLIELQRSPGRRGEKVRPIALYQRIIFECEPKKEQRQAS
jgi:predicted transcriptional regulator